MIECFGGYSTVGAGRVVEDQTAFLLESWSTKQKKHLPSGSLPLRDSHLVLLLSYLAFRLEVGRERKAVHNCVFSGMDSLCSIDSRVSHQFQSRSGHIYPHSGAVALPGWRI